MSVVPIGHQTLTAADIQVILREHAAMQRKGFNGDCIPAMTADGEPVVVLLDDTGDDMVLGIGKLNGWYYAVDNQERSLGSGRFIDDVLAVLRHYSPTYHQARQAAEG